MEETRRTKVIKQVNDIICRCKEFIASNYTLVDYDDKCVNCCADIMCAWARFDYNKIENVLGVPDSVRMTEEERNYYFNTRRADDVDWYSTPTGKNRLKMSYLVDYKKNIGDRKRLAGERQKIKEGLKALGVDVYRVYTWGLVCPRGKGLHIELLVTVSE